MHINPEKKSPIIPDAVVLGTRLTEKALLTWAQQHFSEALVQEEREVQRLDVGILRELIEVHGLRVESLPGSAELLLCRPLNSIQPNQTLEDFEHQLALDLSHLGLEHVSLTYCILNTYSTFTSY